MEAIARRPYEDERKNACGAYQAGGKYTDLANCDLVIETAAEKEDIKRKIFADYAPRSSRSDRCHQHLVDFDYAAGVLDRPAERFHRHSFQ